MTNERRTHSVTIKEAEFMSNNKAGKAEDVANVSIGANNLSVSEAYFKGYMKRPTIKTGEPYGDNDFRKDIAKLLRMVANNREVENKEINELAKRHGLSHIINGNKNTVEDGKGRI